jgi:hypothetical protein
MSHAFTVNLLSLLYVYPTLEAIALGLCVDIGIWTHGSLRVCRWKQAFLGYQTIIALT